MEEEYFVLSLLSTDCHKIGINVPSQSTTLIIQANFNIIEKAFLGLRVLYSQSPYRVTVFDLIGKLLSTTSREYNLCASVLPMDCLEQLCATSLALDSLRVLVESSCAFYRGMWSYEVDSDGNKFPLNRFACADSKASQGHGQNPACDKHLIRDVTDALRTKLLELRMCQEKGDDSYHVQKALMAIWRNAKVLWRVNSDEGIGGELSSRWADILKWNKATHKKQVKSDAKLVLATRVHLEEQSESECYKHDESGSMINRERKMMPSSVLSSISSMELWSLTVLSEYCGSNKTICSYICPFFHKFLCPHGCVNDSKGGSLPYRLNDQHFFSRDDSFSTARKLRTHLHKHRIPTDIERNAFNISEVQESDPKFVRLEEMRSPPSYFYDDDDGRKNQRESMRRSQLHHGHNPTEIENVSNSTANIIHKNQSTTSKKYSNRYSQNEKGINYSKANIPDKPQADIQNDQSMLSSNMSTVIDARSPPRQRPHPYPLSKDTKSPSTKKESAAVKQVRTPPLSNRSWKHRTALDYVEPVSLQDDRMSIDDLDSSYIENSAKEDKTAGGEDEDHEPTTVLSRARKSHPVSYDRSGHRVYSNSVIFAKSQNFSTPKKKTSLDFRRHSVGGHPLGGSDSVAFGRRETNAARKIPATTREKQKAPDPLNQDPILAQARALYRLRNVRRQEIMSQSELQHQEKLRRDRLRAVETKADISRVKSSRRRSTLAMSASRAQSAPRSQNGPRITTSASPPPKRSSSTGRLPRHNTHDREEPVKEKNNDVDSGRKRAAARVRKKRQEMKAQEFRAQLQEQKKSQERWDVRDKKIQKFLERQKSKQPEGSTPETTTERMSGKKSSPQDLPEWSLHINWESGIENMENAMREADEMTSVINNALGPQSAESNEENYIYRNSRGIMEPPPAPYSPSLASQDMLCLKVIQAYDLPNVMGGLNPYIYFDWGKLGRASTQAIENTTAPVFNATLRFKSPSPQGSSLSTALMASPPLTITLFSRNDCMSDTAICGIELDDKDMTSNSPLRVYLQDVDDGSDCGVLEFQVYVM